MADTGKRGKKRPPQRSGQSTAPHDSETANHPVEEEPAVERGERIATGKAIARGGKSTGQVPGATETRPGATAAVVMPPAPPGESAPEEVEKTRAVADALVQLGENADPKRVAEAVKAKTGKEIELDEVVAIQTALRERSRQPPK